MNFNDKFPWATVTAVVLTVIAAIVGGLVVVIGDDGALTFDQYLDAMSKFVIGIGILGVGRGVVAAGRQISK